MVSHSHLGTSYDTPTSDWLSVITPTPPQPGRHGAVLRVDRDHPFFFDHPLDHVPGMLLVTGLLDLVRARTGVSRWTRGDHRIRLSLKFMRMCELGSGVLLLAEPGSGGDDGEWAVKVVQDDSTVCSGTVELVEEREQAAQPCDSERGDPVTPAPPDLVHRADPQNVVVGEPVISPEAYEASTVSPPSGHFLLRHGDERYGIEEMIESGRQLVTVASHLAHERPRDVMMLWLELRADLPVGVRRSVPLGLHWPVRPARGNFGSFDLTVVARATGLPLGSLSYESKCLAPAAYRRLRGKEPRA
ncbi:AfsA-related hotdog domain-containing protein [Streptosporangium carneum]|uniref:A-factor biosynthesis hotdog domain-containing protein n=1 Tax=Streptosporangium carneum TaxID=47481 RepID=A0A9W6I8V4_9ACTN|nr:AfsA-related hotdog domain-containing protein [Streptosporangium carneum]GLK14177.1 hypothetical protein GCM10017600_75890 [Streptosporangium carneum]